MIDDATDFVTAAEALKERGANKIYVLCTHGLLSADAPRILENSPIDEIVVTNTVPHDHQKLQCAKIKTVGFHSVAFFTRIPKLIECTELVWQDNW